MSGYDVFYLTGTDEHGQKIEKVAKEHGESPKSFVDKQVATLKELWKKLDISYDKFIRTTDEYHEKAVQKIFAKLYEKGDIYKSEYEGWYCTPCESFWTKTQLADGKCPDCGREVELTKESSYFFRMSKYKDRLIDLIENNDEFLQPKSRRNEMLNNFLKAGLQDLAVSRTSFKWGVPVPFDKDHVVYVWLDALTNYITALGYGSDDESLFEKYWPADVHVVGKEIVRFHSIIWPALLMALGLPLPKKVFGHGWIKFGGQKMGKSTGNVVDPYILADRYGVDALRYFLLDEMPFGSDCDYSSELLVRKINTDLANDYGNLVRRTLSMSAKYFGGKVTADGEADDADADFVNMINSAGALADEDMDGLQVSKAVEDIFAVIRRANKYIDETAPWKLAADESGKPRLLRVIYNLLEAIRVSSTLLLPFLRTGPTKALGALGVGAPEEFGDNLRYGAVRKYSTTEIPAIYPRLDVNRELEELAAIAAKASAEPASEKDGGEDRSESGAAAGTDDGLITIDDFAKMRLCVAEVIACERVKGSKKLLKETLKVGDETRVVCSGIAAYYTPEEMVGKKVILVANLPPRKMCGVESNGMLLCAEKDGKVVLLTPESDIGSGAEVG